MEPAKSFAANAMASPSINRAPPAPGSLRGVWRWPMVIAVLSLSLGLALSWFVWSGARVRDRSRFEIAAQRTQAAIEARLELYVGMLRAGAGLFAASNEVRPEEFRAFARRIDLPTYYPGVQGIGFARRVAPDERGVFTEKYRRDDGGPVEIFPDGEREEYFPVAFLEPPDRRNQAAIGFDMFSEPGRRAAMERARDLGTPAATGRTVLVQEIDSVKQAGFLVYVAVYRGGVTPPTIEERRASLLGFVYSPFRIGDLLTGILDREALPGVHFDIHFGEEPSADNLLHRSAAADTRRPSFERVLPLHVGDSVWSIRYRTTAAFEARSARGIAAWIAVAGLLMSASMGAVAFALARAMRSAQERGQELFLQKEQLRVTLASIGDAVICTDEKGIVTFMNPVAEQLTGWTLAEAAGRTLQTVVPLLNEGTRRPVRNPIDTVLRRGMKVGLANDTVLVSRRGAWIPIEDSAAPIRAETGELIGVVLVFHDVTAKRRANDALRERERLLAAVAGGAAVGLAIIREDLGHAFANEAYARAFGLAEDEIVPQKASEIAGAAWPRMKSGLDRAFAGETVSQELVLPAPAGRRDRCFAVTYEPQNDGGARTVVAVMLDITDRKLAEANLQASEERRRLAVEAAALGTWDFDLVSGRLLWDERCKQLFGVARDAMVDFDLFVSVLHPEDRERVVDSVRAALDPHEGGGCAIEYRIVRPNDGAERWIRATGKTYFESRPRVRENGAALATRARRLIGTAQDVTEDKRKEATLAFLVELSAATQNLVEPGEIMATTARMLGDHLDVDRCAYAEVDGEKEFVITGDYPRRAPSIVGRWPVASFGPDCVRLMLANKPYVVVDSEADPRVGPEDLPAYRATAIRAVICVPLHKAGKFTAAMAVHQTTSRHWTADDIHLVEMVVVRAWESLERGRSIRSLREGERRLRFMAEAMPQKIFTARPDGAIDYLNRQWIDFAGMPFERLRDWGWLDLVHPDDREESLRRWKQCMETGAAFQMEQRFRRHDGEYRSHLTRARAMRGPDGAISMWIGSNTDITDMVMVRETLAERRQELERLVDERTVSLRRAIEQMEEFSYSISHDLRAPLRAMQGYAQALLEDYGNILDADGHDYLRRIIAASSRMDRLTLDVLTYSKVSREPVQPQRVSLERLVTDCVRQHLDFRDSGADVVVEHPLPDVLGHEPLLMQAISNLVGNALKFVPPDTQPKIRIHAEPLDGGVRLWIEDNGIGIAPKQQKRIWGMFERAHQPGDYPGTGIGLAIVRKAVERMGGEVGVESDGKSGSRFWVRLPSPGRVDDPADQVNAAARTPVS